MKAFGMLMVLVVLVWGAMAAGFWMGYNTQRPVQSASGAPNIIP